MGILTWPDFDKAEEQKSDVIRQERSASEILWWSRKQFEFLLTRDSTLAFLTMGEDYWFLYQRYTSGWKRIIGFWYGFWATIYIKKAKDLGLKNPEQFFTASIILSKIPKRLGGDPSLSQNMIENARLYISGPQWPEREPQIRLGLVMLRAEIMGRLCHGTQNRESSRLELSVQELPLR